MKPGGVSSDPVIQTDRPISTRKVHFDIANGVLMVLYEDGRLFQRTTDPKDFANRPNHVPGFIWTEIKGPLE